MYYQESENFVSNDSECAESITAIDGFLAARSQHFFTLASAELFTDIDEKILEPYLTKYAGKNIIEQQSRLKCDCGNYFVINPIGRGQCDFCNVGLNTDKHPVVQGFVVIAPPRREYENLLPIAGDKNMYSGPKLEGVAQALQSAFNEETFERFLLYKLNIRITDFISKSAGLPAKIHQVLEHLNTQNRVSELVAAAIAENPTNADLKKLS